MLLYIKKHYEDKLNQTQKELLNKYLDTYKPENTRKKGHPYEWAWEIFDSEHFDEVMAEIEENFLKGKNRLTTNELVNVLTQKYRLQPKKLYALVLDLSTWKNPEIPIILKNLVLSYLEKEKDLENKEIWIERVKHIPIN